MRNNHKEKRPKIYKKTKKQKQKKTIEVKWNIHTQNIKHTINTTINMNQVIQHYNIHYNETGKPLIIKLLFES